jgi:hypothetical protein
MTTTTTTTRDIMTRAHEMTRETRREYPAADYRATFAAALRIVWEQAKAESTTARAQWDALDGTEQHDRLLKMAYHRARRNAAETNARGEYRANRYAWAKTADDYESIVNDAWTRLPALLDKNDADESPRPLNIILARACDRAAQYIDRQEKRHANALRTTTATDSDGNETETQYIDDATATAERIAPNPETAAIITDALDRLCADDIDRAILAGMLYGFNMREIAAKIGKSAMYVSRHAAKIKEAYKTA